MDDADDNCPDTENANQKNSDTDPHGDACDNCIEASNYFQINCNLDSELEEGVTPKGDACDPNPCPWSEVTTTETAGTYYWALAGFNRIRASFPHTQDGSSASAVDGWTGPRFCDCAAVETSYPENSTDTRSGCANPLGAGCKVNEPGEYDDPDLSQWHIPTVDYGQGELNDRDGDGREEEVALDYGDTGGGSQLHRVGLSWDYEADESRFDYTLDAADRFEFPSVVWTHTAEARNGVSIDRDFTSHYWSGIQGQEVRDGSRSKPDTDDLFLPYLIPPSPICPVCSNARGAWAYFTPDCADQSMCPEVWFVKMVLDGESSYENAQPQDLADLPGTWVHAAEPDGWREHGVLHATLAQDGSEIYRVLSANEGQGYDLATVDSQGPGARSEFGAVVSQQRDTLFVIGGLDGNGTPRNDLWQYDFGSGSWASNALVGSAPGPERVLAATYSPPERALIVLDRPKGDSTVRLWRLPLPYDKDAAELVRSWQSQGTYTGFGLALASQAPYYNVLCDRGTSGHGVLRLAPGTGQVEQYVQDDAPIRRSVLLGHGAAVSVLAVDDNGTPYALAHDTFTAAGSNDWQLCFD